MNQPVRILYVDDYPLDRDLVRDALEKEDGGFELIEAASRLEFETALAQGNFDLVLSDFNILGFEGLQVLETVRFTGLDLPVIIVTGTGSEEIAAEAIKRGAADYVLKSPKHIQHLPHTIHAVLEKERMKAEQKRVEAELKGSEARYRALFENVGEGIGLVDSEERFIFANPAAETIFGTPPGSLTGRDLRQFVLPESLVILLDQTKRRQAGKKSVYEIDIKRLDGEIRNLLVTASPQLNIRQQFEGTFGVFRDITERKQAEEKIRETEILLKASIESPKDMIILSIDKNYKYLYFNSVHEEVMRNAYGRDVKIGMNLLDCVTNADDRKKAKVNYDLALSGSSHVTIEEYGELERHFYETRYNPIYNAKNEIIGTTAFSANITKRVQAEEEIHRLNNELEQHVEERTRELRQAHEQIIRQEKMAVLGQLAGFMSHELRNPLGIISSAVYYLKLVQPDADDKVREYLAMIEKEVHTAEKIIIDLLDFSRIESSKREPVIIHNLVQRALVHNPVPESIITFQKLSANLPMVLVDPYQIEQVLGNLIVNACQAMLEGGKMTITARQQEEMVAISVKDTGAGIPPENMSKIFEPLFSTREKGIGLGLAVGRKLAEANGGRIEVDSLPGKGSTFTLFLPVQATQGGE